jgi:hypothetical protein
MGRPSYPNVGDNSIKQPDRCRRFGTPVTEKDGWNRG